MKHFIRSKLVLTLIILILLTGAITIPLSSSITHSHAATPATNQTQSDLPYPSWWNGTPCDMTIVSNSAPLGTTYRGMPACGPIGLPANSAHVVTFPGGWGEYEWQCVELSMRFMYLAYGINAYNANGNEVVDHYTILKYDPGNYNNPILVPVSNDASSKTAPQDGDILSYTTKASPGHTSVVIASNVDSSGNGTITVIEQNFSSAGKAVLKVGANANKRPWVIGGGVKNWLHHTVDLTPQSAPASASVVVSGTGFRANEKVTINFDGTLLSTVTATPNGTLSTTITVPATASLGIHHIQLIGQTSAFSPKTVFYVVQSSSPPPGTITEFSVPTSNSSPEGITSGPDGNLWFTEYAGSKIGKITPSGTITEYPIPTTIGEPWGITSGPDGNLWFTEYYLGKIGRITPSGTITEYSLPANSLVESITSGPDGNLWFTETDSVSHIGKITPSGTITEYPIPTTIGEPWGITSGPDGNLWFTEYYGSKIGSITPAGSVTEYPLPISNSYPAGITSGPDGNLWFTESYTPSQIGRITPSGTITEYPLPGYKSEPFGITSYESANRCITLGWLQWLASSLANCTLDCGFVSGPDGNLWFTESFTNQIGRITPSGTITEYPTPTANSSPQYITSGPDGNLWFTEYYGNKIGKITP